MRRSHRRIHRAIWPVLALAIGLGVAMALILREPAATETQSTSEDGP